MGQKWDDSDMSDLERDMAYKSGYEDGYDGKPHCNASDVYGPYSGDYYDGYYAGQKAVNSWAQEDNDPNQQWW